MYFCARNTRSAVTVSSLLDHIYHIKLVVIINTAKTRCRNLFKENTDALQSANTNTVCTIEHLLNLFHQHAIITASADGAFWSCLIWGRSKHSTKLWENKVPKSDKKKLNLTYHWTLNHSKGDFLTRVHFYSEFLVVLNLKLFPSVI